MSVFGVSVTKRGPWRNSTVVWSNRYHFFSPGTIPGAAEWKPIIERVMDLERPIHSGAVTFVEGRLWGPTDVADKALNLMRHREEWGAITGSAAAGTGNWYRELALLVVFPLGRYGKKNRPQFLRKWIHTYTDFGLIPATAVNGNTTIQSEPAAFPTYRAGIRSLSGTGITGGPYLLCTEKDGGRQPLDGGRLYPWVEHHQFGR